jgi:hypothetical protein
MIDGIDPQGCDELDSILRRLTLLGEHVSVKHGFRDILPLRAAEN